jgi:hypothetical protein
MRSSRPTARALGRRVSAFSLLLPGLALWSVCCAASPLDSTIPHRPTHAPPAGADAVLLEFLEQEAGTDPYATRTIVTARYLRLDFGPDDPDFLLYDRSERIAYSINSEDRRILVIPWSIPTDPEPPITLDLAETTEIPAEVPPVAGGRVVATRYAVNGRHCRDTMSVPNLLPAAVAAMGELRLLLANRRIATLHNTPAEFWDVCELAYELYAPLRTLDAGFPLVEWTPDGFRRELVRYDTSYVPAPDELLLPTGFARVRMGNGGQEPH